MPFSPSHFAPDALSLALDLVRCRGAGLRVLHPPVAFATRVPAGAPIIHLVDAGRIHLDFENGESLALEPGDVAIVPHGLAHRVGAGEAPPQPLDSFAIRPDAIDKSPGAPPVEVCWALGEFAFDGLRGRDLFAALPQVIVARAKEARRPLIAAALAALVEEARAGGPGAAVVAARALELLVVDVVRVWAARAPTRSWLAGAMDARIGRALAALHAEPARVWTVPELARRSAMSRSSFAERFGALVGRAPIAYLVGLRLDQAAAALRDSDDPIGVVARASGFSSPAAFTRAFRQRFGDAPARWRAAARALRPPA